MRDILEVLEALQPSRRHRDEVGAGHARHRHSRRAWRNAGLAKVALSVTTLDRHAGPHHGAARRDADQAAGGDAACCATPAFRPRSWWRRSFPALNDSGDRAHPRGGARCRRAEAGYVILRLPLEVASIFRDWLLRHYPDRYRHVMSLLRSMRGGKDYDSEWGKRMKGTGPYAWQIGRRFEDRRQETRPRHRGAQ